MSHNSQIMELKILQDDIWERCLMTVADNTGQYVQYVTPV